ncbi:uncharacterized protein LOC103518318 [Diaphorina citri]|uniref:Uncharacterized protein LOC103518318 n=1 Tax=Diaphorina citri TaxID=121845 RepID=A0A1S3DH78_DIACI|nr:uncharacterized protein LOC103518318 [Diaphorina citri]KAI5708369.1 hypothetical protein M8J77_021319 [Diaphorina citri]
MQCITCNILIKRGDDNLTCKKCEKSAHFTCAGLTEAQVKVMKTDKTKWFCPECSKMEAPKPALQRTSSTDRNIQSMLEDMNKKISFMVAQLADTNAKVTALVEENKVLKLELNLKDKKITKMQERLDSFDQRLRINNIEITNLPEKKDEDIREVVKSVIRAAGYREIKDEDIQATHRVPKFNKNGKNIVVHLTSRWTRNKILQAAKKFRKTAKRGLSSKDVDAKLPDATIYISEHLCPAYKQLLNKTKAFARDKGYKHVWVHEGRILMKRKDEDKTIHIKSEEDLPI